MGKTYKDNRNKYKNNRDFQKKQSKNKKGGNKPYSPFDDTQDYHESFGGK